PTHAGNETAAAASAVGESCACPSEGNARIMGIVLDTYKNLVLDAFQREALDAIAKGESVIVAAPTGAGKTLIAEFAIEKALAEGRRVVYTAPIKALSNQKFRDFSASHPGEVGITTGDVSINPGARATIMTTEIFRNTIFDA